MGVELWTRMASLALKQKEYAMVRGWLWLYVYIASSCWCAKCISVLTVYSQALPLCISTSSFCLHTVSNQELGPERPGMRLYMAMCVHIVCIIMGYMCVCVCVCVHIVCMCIVCIWLYVYVCVRILYACGYMCAFCVYMCVHIVCIWLYVCVCVHVNIYCVYVVICVHIVCVHNNLVGT